MSSSIPASLRVLLSDLIDYAGLFPPAALDMKSAVGNYARYLAGPDAWALARFVLPVSRFAEFEAAMNFIQPVEPWGISALLGTSPEAELAEIDHFNNRNKGRAAVDAVEGKAATSEEICRIRAFVRNSITCYFEIPPRKASELLPTISALHARAKIRTGGITADAFPSSETIARFLLECAKHNVQFKATAGLHHPIRCVSPLTYDANAPAGAMHGFLNVFLAAMAATEQGRRIAEDRALDWLVRVLESKAPKLEFTDDCVLVAAEGEPIQISEGAELAGAPVVKSAISTARIRDARQHFAISFGSCSFEEPLADLRDLKLL